MTNKNFYDDDSNTTKIPNFANGTDTDTNSIDMSIFKMSDDELYDDVPKKKKEAKSSGPKKKVNTTVALCLVVSAILFVVALFCCIYALNAKKNVTLLQDKITQLQASASEKESTISNLTVEVETLRAENEQLKANNSGSNTNTTTDPNNKYPKGTKLYITEDGSKQGVRASASKDAETLTDSEGNNIVLYWGDEATLAEDATKDSSGNYWAKVSKITADGKEITVNNGYIRIEWDGEIWATVKEQ